MKGDTRRLGWLCAYTPEEIIVASGLTPSRIRGNEEVAPGGATRLPVNLCPYVRSVLDEALRGHPERFEGVSLVASCDAMRRLGDAWRREFPGIPVFMIDFPRRTGSASLAYLTKQFEAYRDWLGGISGKLASDDDLREATRRVAAKRRSLLELSARRMSDPPGISGSDFYHLVSLASEVSIEEFEAHCRSFTLAPVDGGPRIVLTGSIIEGGRIYRTIQEAGAQVVAEDVCTGLRGIEGDVDTGGDPIESIAKRYLRRPPCSRMSDLKGRNAYIKQLVHEYRAQGVIYHCLKFCDQYQYDYPLLRKRLEETGIPVLRIETDYREGDSGQLQTRVEAFVEMLNEKVRRAV